MKLLLFTIATFAFALKSVRRTLQDSFNPDDGCPNAVNPDFNFEFQNADVIHRNLGGHWCDYNPSNQGCEDIDPSTNQPVAEILYCNVGTSSTGTSGDELCLRVRDVSNNYPNAEPFQCQDEIACGNVKESDSVLGQVQIDMNGAHCRLEFQTVDCSADPDNHIDCDAVTWDAMVMTFTDIDGNQQSQEDVILHDLFHYTVPANFENGDAGFDGQDVYGAAFAPCEWSPNERRCFSNMQIQIEDPNGVYIYQTEENQPNDERPINFNIGDVTVRNMLGSQVTDASANGNILNPTSLETMNNQQLARSIQAYWVSDRILSLATGGSVAPESTRSTFQVSFGTLKRTILFAGYSSAVAGERCETCTTSGVTCAAGSTLIPNRVCFLASEGLDGCNTSTCCESSPTSHGDPIIWTLKGECYDLSKDGFYSATAHPDFDHEVKIAVYNDYMREIQVLNNDGEILLSIDNTGNVVNNDFPFTFTQKTTPCPEEVKDCIGEYTEFEFDAQDFRYFVQTLRHDYNDAALKFGEWGYHLDIYPRAYDGYVQNRRDYSGLYFENPLPEELEYCPDGSRRD